MSGTKVRAVCLHRVLMVKGSNRTRSVEMSRCYECGTPLNPPPPNVRLRLVPVPTKETLSDTQTHPTSGTDAS